MTTSSVDIIYYNQFSGEICTNSTPLLVMNQLSHQESGTYNLKQFTSNPGTLPPKTNRVVSAIMGKLNHHAIDNGDVEVHPSEYPFASNSESVPYTYTNPIK